MIFFPKFKPYIEVRNEKKLPVMIQMWQLSNIEKVRTVIWKLKDTFQDYATFSTNVE